jgi:hypothetical protein
MARIAIPTWTNPHPAPATQPEPLSVIELPEPIYFPPLGPAFHVYI